MTAQDQRPRVRSRWRGRRRLLAVMGVAVATVTGAVVVSALPSALAATVDTAATYVFVNRNSGKAMDLYNWSTAENAPVNQWSRNDLAVQQWQFVDAGAGSTGSGSRHSGKVLELPNGTDGTQLVQTTDRGAATQQFRLQDSAGGSCGSSTGSRARSSTCGSGPRLMVAGWLRIRTWMVSISSGSWSASAGPPPPPPAAAPRRRLARRRRRTRSPAGSPATPACTTRRVVKRPDGGYLVAHTGNNIALKTSTDRIAFRNAGAVFPGGASWTTTYTGGSAQPVGAGPLLPQRPVLPVLLRLDVRLQPVGDLPGHQHHRRVRQLDQPGPGHRVPHVGQLQRHRPEPGRRRRRASWWLTLRLVLVRASS